MGAEQRSWNGDAAFMEEEEGRGRGAPAVAEEEGGGALEKGLAVASEVPASSISIDISLPLHQMKSRIVDLIKDLFKKWSSLDETHFIIETVSGGITNLLLKVSIREEKGNVASLTVRLYGPNTEFVIDRKRELKAIRYLSSAGFGAKLLGLFANGMVQSFIDARTLSPPDMSKPKLVAKIARELRKFHQVEIPGSKEPQLWNDIFKFLDKAGAIKFDDIEKQTRYESISFEEIHNEITQLKKSYTSLTSSMDHTTIEAMTLQIISMSMQALNATITCIQIRIRSITSSGTIYNLGCQRR